MRHLVKRVIVKTAEFISITEEIISLIDHLFRNGVIRCLGQYKINTCEIIIPQTVLLVRIISDKIDPKFVWEENMNRLGVKKPEDD